jgi:hypothetical protein
MTDTATDTNNGSNGNDEVARQVHFSEDTETGPDTAATATAVTPSKQATEGNNSNTPTTASNPYVSTRKRTPTPEQSPNQGQTGQPAVLNLAPLMPNAITGNTGTPAPIKNVLPPLPLIPIVKPSTPLNTEQEPTQKKKKDKVKSVLDTMLTSLPEALHEPVKKLTKTAKGYSLTIQSKARSLTRLSSDETIPKSCRLNIHLTTKSELEDAPTFKNLSEELSQLKEAFQKDAKDIMIRNLQHEIKALTDIKFTKIISDLVSIAELLTIYARHIHKQIDTGLEMNNKALAIHIAFDTLTTSKIDGQMLMDYFNKDHADLIGHFQQLSTDYLDEEVDFKSYEGPPDVDDMNLVSEASTALTALLPTMLFETQSLFDIEQRRKEANDLAKAHSLHEQTLDVTEETEAALEEQLKNTDETVKAIIEKAIKTNTDLIFKKIANQQTPSKGKGRRQDSTSTPKPKENESSKKKSKKSKKSNSKKAPQKGKGKKNSNKDNDKKDKDDNDDNKKQGKSIKKQERQAKKKSQQSKNQNGKGKSKNQKQQAKKKADKKRNREESSSDKQSKKKRQKKDN